MICWPSLVLSYLCLQLCTLANRQQETNTLLQGHQEGTSRFLEDAVSLPNMRRAVRRAKGVEKIFPWY